MSRRPKGGNPRLIAINGDVCSGSSSLAKALSTRLGYDLFDLGQAFRHELRVDPTRNVSELSLALNGLVVQQLATADRRIIEGRLVGLQARPYPDVLKLLCVAPEGVVIERYAQREEVADLDAAKLALAERYERDETVLQSAWRLGRSQIFDPQLYDVVVDTSLAPPDELVVALTAAGHIGDC